MSYRIAYKGRTGEWFSSTRPPWPSEPFSTVEAARRQARALQAMGDTWAAQAAILDTTGQIVELVPSRGEGLVTRQ
jgi:hypothetical protein